MRQKMINLCPATFETAYQMENFSEWVRMKLKEEALMGNPFAETYLHLCVIGCQKVTEYKNSPMCPQHRIRMKLVPSKLVGTE